MKLEKAERDSNLILQGTMADLNSHFHFHCIDLLILKIDLFELVIGVFPRNIGSCSGVGIFSTIFPNFSFIFYNFLNPILFDCSINRRKIKPLQQLEPLQRWKTSVHSLQ